MNHRSFFVFLILWMLLNLFIDEGSYSQQYWIRKPSPTTNHLYKCCFTDTSNGWAAGDSGIIIHTSNGGASWIVQPSHISYAITNLFFLNKRLGWCIANDFFYQGTTILRTTNGGLNWTYSRYQDTTLILNTVLFMDSLHGIMGGYEGAIVQTSDAGASWDYHRLDTISFYSHFPILHFSFLNSAVGFASGGIFDIAGLIWKTTNSGLNWDVRDTTPEPLTTVRCLDSLKVLATGGDFEYGCSITKSTDSGKNWRYTPVGYFGQGQALAFRTRAEIWVPLGFSERWMVSFDSSNNWNELFVQDSNAVYDALFIDSMHGWAVGNNGAIYKYISSLIGIEPNPQELPLAAQLFQNYPNPFNPSTTITFDLSRPSRVKITLFDILGREVKLLYDGLRSAGTNKILFDAAGLGSGVYFYKLDTEVSTQTKKMVLIK
ncbi:MAG: YCF48-related protein [Ignavibacteria bacterium]